MRNYKKLLSYTVSATIFATTCCTALTAQAVTVDNQTTTTQTREYLGITNSNTDLYYDYEEDSFFEKNTSNFGAYIFIQTDGTLSKDFFKDILENQCELTGSEFYIDNWSESYLASATFKEKVGIDTSEFDENTYWCGLYVEDTANSTYLADDLKTYANYMYTVSDSVEEVYTADIYSLICYVYPMGVGLYVDSDSDFSEDDAKELLLEFFAENTDLDEDDINTIKEKELISTGSYAYFEDEKCIYLILDSVADIAELEESSVPLKLRKYELYETIASEMKEYDEITNTDVFIEYCDCISLCYDIYGELVDNTTSETIEATTEETTEATETTENTDSTEATEATESTTSSASQYPLYGDINCDESVSIADVVLLNKYLVGNADLEVQALANADCNADGTVDASDAVIILGLNVQKYTQAQLPITE